MLFKVIIANDNKLNTCEKLIKLVRYEKESARFFVDRLMKEMGLNNDPK